MVPADLRAVEKLKCVPGMQPILDEASTRAIKMIDTGEFAQTAWEIEKALWSQPILYEEDIQEAINRKMVAPACLDVRRRVGGYDTLSGAAELEATVSPQSPQDQVAFSDRSRSR